MLPLCLAKKSNYADANFSSDGIFALTFETLDGSDTKLSNLKSNQNQPESDL